MPRHSGKDTDVVARRLDAEVFDRTEVDSNADKRTVTFADCPTMPAIPEATALVGDDSTVETSRLETTANLNLNTGLSEEKWREILSASTSMSCSVSISPQEDTTCIEEDTTCNQESTLIPDSMDGCADPDGTFSSSANGSYDDSVSGSSAFTSSSEESPMRHGWFGFVS